ncbi:MAG: DsbA family protein [Rhodospirillales bacterium]|nr:DsbA family protein [Rhodospirillales bacterium]
MSAAAAASQSAGTAGRPARRFLYIADPMCSWCWGFAPVIGRIAADYGAQAPVRLIAGGLRIGTTEPMDQRAKDYVRHHWGQVQAMTGQPFDFAFFERRHFLYDTLPACRAAVAMRNLIPDHALEGFAAIQRAFYAENRDVTQIDVLADIAAAAGIDRETFLAVYGSDEVGESLAADLAAVKALDVSGFPALLIADEGGAALLTVGYRSFAALQPLIDRWLQGPQSA